MRLAYLGTPQMAVPPLEALHAAGHDIALVVSGADKRRGRGNERSPSPVKAAAMRLGLEVTDRLEDVAAARVDLGVVVAYGRIIPVALLDAVPMVNLHFSLLPRWRGAAPVERAILAGDDRTGVCLMEVAEGLDTGGIHACVDVPIGPSTTAAELREQLVREGAELLVRSLADGLGEPSPQPDEGVTYAAKLRADDLRLDWQRPAGELGRVVRVGGAWTTLDGRRLKVLEAEPADEPTDAQEASAAVPGTLIDATSVSCGEGALRLRRVQPEGRPPMDAPAWANGARAAGRRLGT